MKDRYYFYPWLSGKYKGYFIRSASIFIFIGFLLATTTLQGQTDAVHETENRLKKAAEKDFDQGNFIEAYPLYSQLVSLYPRDPNYNYRFGTCMLFTTADKKKAMDYLIFSIKQGPVENLAYYYLGKALHLNYKFNEAITSYQKFQGLASSSELKKYPVTHLIDMCNNGMVLVANLRGLDVLRKKEISLSYYFEAYDIHANGGTVLSEPDDFKTKIDKEKSASNLMYLTPDRSEAFFSSYGTNDENGKDIYVVKRKSIGTWSIPENLGNVINTVYDEDYPVYDAPHHTLYFCSKGHNSMGGYDIFKSFYDESSQTWTEPINLDFPINSPDDDILFVPDTLGKTAFFASTRSSPSTTIDVYKVSLYSHPPELVVIEGTSYMSNGITPASSKIIVRDLKTDSIVGVYNSSSVDGKYSFSLPKGGKYSFTVEDSASHKSQTQTVTLPVSESTNAMKQDIQFTSSGDIQIKNSSAEVPKDSVYQLAYNSIEEQAQMNVNVDTNSVQTPITQSPSSVQNKNATASSDTAKSLVLNTAKLERDEEQLNNKSTKTIDYAGDKLEEAQELQIEAKNILHGPDGSAGSHNTDSVTYAKGLLKQSAAAEEKGLQAYRYAAEYKNEAAAKQSEIDKTDNSNSSLQSLPGKTTSTISGSEPPPVKVSPGDLIRIQAGKIVDDSMDVVHSNEELTEEMNGLQQQSHEFLAQAGQTGDTAQKVALLHQADDLTKDNQEKEEEINENNLQLKQIHDEHSWLNNKARKADSDFVVYTNKNSSGTNNGDMEPALQKEINEYAAANNLDSDTTAIGLNDNESVELANNNGNNTSKAVPGTKHHTRKNGHNTSQPVVIAAGSSSVSQGNNSISKDNPGSGNNQVTSNPNDNFSASAQNADTVAANKNLLTVNGDNPQSTPGRNNISLSNDTSALAKANSSEGFQLAKNNNITPNLNTNNIPSITDTTAKQVSDTNKNSQIAKFDNATIKENENNNLPVSDTIIAPKTDSSQNSTIANINTDIPGANQGHNLSVGDTVKTIKADSTQSLQIAKTNNDTIKANENTANHVDDVMATTKIDSSQNLTIAKNSSPSNEKESNVLTANNTLNNISSDSNRSLPVTKTDNTTPNGNAPLTAKIGSNLSSQIANDDKTSLKERGANNSTIPKPTNDDSIINLPESAPIANNTINNTAGKKDSVTGISRESSSIIVSENTLPVSYGYHETSMPHEKLLDSLANAIPKSKSLEWLSQNSTKNAVSTIQYSDTVAVSLKQKSQCYFDAAGILSDNAMALHTKARNEKNIRQASILRKKADSLDNLVLQLNLKGNANLAEADYHQYRTNMTEIAGINAKPDAGDDSKITEDNIDIKEAKISYQKSISERDKANNTSVLKDKHANIKSAREELATAILKQQQAAYLYFQADSIHQVRTMIASHSSNNSAPLYTDFLKTHQMAMLSAPVDNSISTEVSDNSVVSKTETNQKAGNIKTDSSTKVPAISPTLSVTKTSDDNNRKENNTINTTENIPETVEANPGSNNKPVSKSKATSVSISDTVNIFKEVAVSPYSVSNPIPINPPLPTGLFFKVQVGAFRKPIPQNLFKGIEPIAGIEAPGGYIRYSTGLFRSYDSAKNVLVRVRNRGYKDAFIIAFYNGIRIPIQEAMAKLGIPSQPVTTTVVLNGKDSPVTKVISEPATVVPSSSDNKASIIAENTIAPTDKALIDSGSDAILSIKDTIPPAAESFNTIKGLVFTVQVGAFSKHKGFIRLRKIKHLYTWTDADGSIKYNSGAYKSIADAKAAKNIIIANTTVKDAFISAYFNGRRISIADANQLLNGGPPPTNQQPVAVKSKIVVKDTNRSSVSAIGEPINKRDTVSPVPVKKENKEYEQACDSLVEFSGKTGVIYSIRVAAFSGQMPLEDANKMLKYSSVGIEPHKEKNGLTAYYAGKFSDYNSAGELQQKLMDDGFRKAFIVAYFNGKKISLDVARTVTNK